jgi:hypothetical protein
MVRRKRIRLGIKSGPAPSERAPAQGRCRGPLIAMCCGRPCLGGYRDHVRCAMRLVTDKGLPGHRTKPKQADSYVQPSAWEWAQMSASEPRFGHSQRLLGRPRKSRHRPANQPVVPRPIMSYRSNQTIP